MTKTLILIFLCIFEIYYRPNEAYCSVNQANKGFGKTVKCWDATLSEMGRTEGSTVSAISVANSKIINVPAHSFSNYAKTLWSLALSNCELNRIDPKAFAGLTLLRKLKLANNNLTNVQSEWFANLISLEELDLTFNSIEEINPSVIAKLTNLRLLNLNDNRLKCLEPSDMKPMRSVAKIYIVSNPLNLVCRAKMTQWFNDKGIKYSHVLDTRSGSWLDRVLWLCAQDDNAAAIDETHMRECVIWNFFEQLRSALRTTQTYRTSAGRCVTELKRLPFCLRRSANVSLTNGRLATDVIVALREARDQLQKSGKLSVND